MIVFVDKVRFLRVAVHLQTDFLVGVLQLGGWDQVVPLEAGHVVHGLGLRPLSLGLPVDVSESQAHHAQQHQQRHQAHSQRHGRPLETVFSLSVGHGRGDGSQQLALRSGEAPSAGAGRRGSACAGAPAAAAPVEAGPGQALVQDSVAVASAVAGGADAGVVVDSVLAGAPVEAGTAGALVDVDFTPLAGEPGATAAHPHAAVDQAQPPCRRGESNGVRPVSRASGLRLQQMQLICTTEQTAALKAFIS